MKVQIDTAVIEGMAEKISLDGLNLVGAFVDGKIAENMKKNFHTKHALLNARGHKVFKNERFVRCFVNIIYAAIHELGGVITAQNAPYLWFKTDDGMWHKVKSVTIPARPYIRPAVYDNLDSIMEIFAHGH